VDFGLFVLINVYCPNLSSDERMAIKTNYYYLLQERGQLVEVDHREVIVVGEINVTATPDDRSDGHLQSYESTFWDEPRRKWFHERLYPQDPMYDVIRRSGRTGRPCIPVRLSFQGTAVVTEWFSRLEPEG